MDSPETLAGLGKDLLASRELAPAIGGVSRREAAFTYGSVCSGIEAAKICAACSAEKPAAAFHRQGRAGRHSYCADCYNAKYRGNNRKVVPATARRAQNISARYGLTPGAHACLLESQDGLCAICRQEMLRPCIDHDHATGAVRGILCHACNIKLPAIEDADFLRRAKIYLGRR
jgi:hypothetical protein